MLPTLAQLRGFLHRVIDDAAEQGHVTDGLASELDGLPPSYDAAADFAHRLAALPLRDDWPYVEPDDLSAIADECDPLRPLGALGALGPVGDVADAADRVRAAFLSRVCGCVLGKPFEIVIGLDEIRSALERNDEWPLRDYPTEAALRSLPTLQGQWTELARERIGHVAPDDDINYTILAMLVLEQHGVGFTPEHLRTQWLYNLPVLVTFGPERSFLIASALQSLEGEGFDPGLLNPGSELCGALIRADAYGYAAIGDPSLAAELAHRDASMTHRRTGVYGAMFVAAAIAASPFASEPLDMVRHGLRYVPQRSRFHERASECLSLVEAASDWLDGYERIRERLGGFGFCRIYQELGCVINTLRFAIDPGDGICMQVMQGNDTDSFAATAGSLLGAFHGPIARRWYEPFNDDVHTALAIFHERSLAAITERMAALPSQVSGA
jgi:ADP-ribosylglycohydrolase